MHAPQSTPQSTKLGLKPHHKEGEVIILFDKGLTNEQIAKLTGIGKRQVRHITDRIRIEREAIAKAEADLIFTKAEEKLSDKSKLTITDAIRIHQARLDKSFDYAVNTEVRRRIDLADNAVRIQNKEISAQLIVLNRMVSQRGVFTEAQYKQMLMLCHPDSSASQETKNELLDMLIQNKNRLIKS